VLREKANIFVSLEFNGVIYKLRKGLLVSYLSLHMHQGCYLFIHASLCCILPLCPTHPLLRPKDGKYKFFHCEDSVTGSEVDLWPGCHGYLMPVISFAVWHLPSNEVSTS